MSGQTVRGGQGCMAAEGGYYLTNLAVQSRLKDSIRNSGYLFTTNWICEAHSGILRCRLFILWNILAHRSGPKLAGADNHQSASGDASDKMGAHCAEQSYLIKFI